MSYIQELPFSMSVFSPLFFCCWGKLNYKDRWVRKMVNSLHSIFPSAGQRWSVRPRPSVYSCPYFFLFIHYDDDDDNDSSFFVCPLYFTSPLTTRWRGGKNQPSKIRGGGGFKSIRPKRLAACSFCCSSLDSQEQTLSMPFKYVFIWKIGFEGKSAELFCLIGLPNF